MRTKFMVVFFFQVYVGIALPFCHQFFSTILLLLVRADGTHVPDTHKLSTATI